MLAFLLKKEGNRKFEFACCDEREVEEVKNGIETVERLWS